MATVTFDGGVSRTGINVAALPAVAVGARLELAGRGRSTATQWLPRRVVRAGEGTGSPDPGGPYSTPVLDDIVTQVVIGADGTVHVLVHVSLWLVTEQYFHNTPTYYQVQVRNASTGIMAAEAASPIMQRVAGYLYADLAAGATVKMQVAPLTYDNAPPATFPPHYGIVGLEDEYIRYATAAPWTPVPGTTGRELLTLERGYDGSTDASHVAGITTQVVLRGLTVTIQGLEPDQSYEARIQAMANDGRASGWSDWEAFTTATDTTAPSWSTGPVVTVESGSYGMLVSWPPADTDATDLARYDVQVSVDGVTWDSSDIYNAGSGTRWTFPAQAGFVRWFRVRAADTTGNVSSWSAATRGAMSLPNEPRGTNLLANPTFLTDTTGWSIASLSGTATLTRDAIIYFDAAGAAKLIDTRTGIMSTAEVTSGTSAISGGSNVYLRGFLRAQSAISGDEGALILRFHNSGSVVIAQHSIRFNCTDIASATRWFPVAAITRAPLSAAYVSVLLSWTIAAGSGAASLWADGLAVYEAVTNDNAFVAINDASSNPGAAAKALKTTGAGGLTLQTITLAVLTAAPSSPANGMIVYADGTSWDPVGKGGGFYGYQAGAWEKFV